MCLDVVNFDIRFHIFSECDPCDKYTLRRTCKLFYQELPFVKYIPKYVVQWRKLDRHQNWFLWFRHTIGPRGSWMKKEIINLAVTNMDKVMACAFIEVLPFDQLLFIIREYSYSKWFKQNCEETVRLCVQSKILPKTITKVILSTSEIKI